MAESPSLPADLQALLDRVAEGAAHSCGADDVNIWFVSEDVARRVAHRGPLAVPGGSDTVPLDEMPGTARAFRDRRTNYSPDIRVISDPGPRTASQVELGIRTILTTPLLVNDRALGFLAARSERVDAFSEEQIAQFETYAELAAVAIDRAQLSAALEAKTQDLDERNADLHEALKQQTATAEVLSIIASSPTELQPVLAAIAENAAKVCGANDANIRLIEGNELVVGATYGELQPPVGPLYVDRPRTPGGGWGPQAVQERRPIQVADLWAGRGPRPEGEPGGGYRAVLNVPLLREGEPIGVVQIRRAEPGLWSDKQVQLLETFAAQAVIAIENVRLFTELRESLEQQTAMSEVLEIIAGSPTDVQPVLDAICASAAKVCAAANVGIRLKEGDDLTVVAHYGGVGAPPGQRLGTDRQSPSGRAILDGGTVHIPDIIGAEGFSDAFKRTARERGFRSVVTTPLIREGFGIGAIAMEAVEPNAFSEKQIALLETFASQAVIAIENVRLFHEIEERNAALGEALEHQTATAEVLSIISRSAFDLQTVLQTLVDSAVRLCGAAQGAVFRVFGDEYRLETLDSGYRDRLGPDYEQVKANLGHVPITPDSDSGATRAIIERRVQHEEIEEVAPLVRELWDRVGVKRVMFLPLLRGEQAIGMFALDTVEKFTERQEEFARTFADQAVIAIENARLFDELQEKTREQAETSKSKRL